MTFSSAIREMVKTFHAHGLQAPREIIVSQTDFIRFQKEMDDDPTVRYGVVFIVPSEPGTSSYIYWGVKVTAKKCTCGAL